MASQSTAVPMGPSAAANTATTNGLTSHSPATANNSAERAVYDTILRLQDAVIAGKHPTIKLPTYVIQQLVTSSALEAPASAAPIAGAPTSHYPPRGGPNGRISNAAGASVTTRPDGESSRSGAQQLEGVPSAPTASRPPSGPQRPALLADKSSSSGIDPVLLEKSDELVRAEFRMKRERIERELARQRMADTQKNDEKLVNVVLCLEEARKIVKPESGYPLPSGGETSSTDTSFDENSYYSSQANSWGSDETPTQEGDSEGGEEQADIEEPPYSPTELFQSVPADTSLQAPPPANNNGATQPVHEESEEYEPPAPEVFPATGSSASNHTTAQGAAYDNRRVAQEPPLPQGAASPATVPVYRNHIETPVAPQPARVSPLATAKAPRLDQSRPANAGMVTDDEVNFQEPDEDLEDSGGVTVTGKQPTSPNQTRGGQQDSTGAQNRKRKQNNGKRDNGRKKQQRRGLQEQRPLQDTDMEDMDISPEPPRRTRGLRRPATPKEKEPVIKQEPPVSPPYADPTFFKAPPLPEFPHPAQRSRSRVAGEASREVEVLSPREVHQRHPVYIREPELGPPPRAHRYEYEEPYAPEYVRVPSRTAVYSPHRYVERDDRDLRRIASIQSARRPGTPPQYVPAYYAADDRMARAASHTYIERAAEYPAPRIYREYRERSPRPIETRYVRSERSRSPPGPPPMPARRIVVDQHGRELYAASPPPADYRASVGPSRHHTLVDDDAPYIVERMHATRDPSVIVPRDAAQHGFYADDDMPPPPPRRYADADPELQHHHRFQPAYLRSYRQRDYPPAPAPQPASMAPPPPPSLRSRGGPEEYVAVRDERGYERYERRAIPVAVGPVPARAYSVRPDFGGVEYVARQESVQPPAGGRAASAVPQPRNGAALPDEDEGRVQGRVYGRAVGLHVGGAIVGSSCL
ncbi:hypothetical protein BDY21DRAFT_422475 [Lineolata rhizophorae]|uniref:Uncharacterized protein n=1 Tax=Lineolata rhizophorae TaxID=578093 RepID=A0A6A6NXD7_9PEZI|nr:hypothetical protein BDY21DRAFT_422475 [Lineolata rhizophorae]